MAQAAKSETKKMPKGGARGGTRFPQVNLQKALGYGKKLVSKTHNGPQPRQTILIGVFNNKGGLGNVRASALKQYGLMEGDTSEGYVASQLARDIEGAIPEERRGLVQRAFLASKLFKQIYDTLQPDTVTRARVRQVVITEKVHPESADECVACFIEGAVHAGLGTLNGDSITLTKVDAVPSPAGLADNGRDVDESEQIGESKQQHEAEEAESKSPDASESGGQLRHQTGDLPHADVRVNLAVDSSSDPDKLEKQLKLLKQYGLLR